MQARDYLLGIITQEPERNIAMEVFLDEDYRPAKKNKIGILIEERCIVIVEEVQYYVSLILSENDEAPGVYHMCLMMIENDESGKRGGCPEADEEKIFILSHRSDEGKVHIFHPTEPKSCEGGQRSCRDYTINSEEHAQIIAIYREMVRNVMRDKRLKKPKKKK